MIPAICFFALLLLTPFVYMRKVGIIRRHPKLMLILPCGCYVLMGISLAYPHLLFEGFFLGHGGNVFASPFLLILVGVLSAEGTAITFPLRKQSDASLSSVYSTCFYIQATVVAICLVSILVMFTFGIGLLDT